MAGKKLGRAAAAPDQPDLQAGTESSEESGGAAGDVWGRLSLPAAGPQRLHVGLEDAPCGAFGLRVFFYWPGHKRGSWGRSAPGVGLAGRASTGRMGFPQNPVYARR